MFGKQKQPHDSSATNRLRELEDIIKALNISQAVMEFSPDGTVLCANDNFYALMGYQSSEVLGNNHSMFMPAEEYDSAEYREFWNTLRSGQFVSMQCRRIDRRKHHVWLQANYCPLTDEHGKVTKIIKFATDITKQRLKEADFTGQLAAIDRAQATIEFDINGFIESANPNFLSVMGYELEDLKGQHHSILVAADDAAQETYTLFWEKMRQGEFVADRVQRITKSGESIWLQATYNPILDPTGRPTKVVKYAIDITSQKQSEEHLETLIKETMSVMSSLAEGDLTQSMQGTYRPDLMVLADAINSTTKQLRSYMARVADTSKALHESASHLNGDYAQTRSAAHQTAEQTQEVAAAAQLISSNVHDAVDALQGMIKSVDQVSSNAAEAASVAEKAVVMAESAKLNVNQLAESSSDIGAVIKVINTIADQTNLLALNATIEAARAGEAGKGFAVVANEVKELAKETARATEEVSSKISTIQNDSQVAVKAINDIGSTIGSISETQSAIALSVKEQSLASTNINRSVHEVSNGSSAIEITISEAARVAAENQARADSSQATTDNLNMLANDLSNLVGQFVIKAP